MKAAIHYIVKVKIIVHNKDTNEIDFQEFERKFENENPILAREDAFDDYEHHIKNFLLGSKNKEYKSDRQAREDLKSFIDHGTKTKFKFGEKEVGFSDSYGNGIGVYLVIDEPKPNSDDKIGDELFIHGIKAGLFSNDTVDTSSIMFALTMELDYYRHYNYDTKNKEIEVIYCDNEEWDEPDNEEPSTNNILETPFDWEGYDKPYWWGEPVVEEHANTKKLQLTIEEIIQHGENHKVEFKSSLLYHFKTGKAGISIKEKIAKAICAFLNSDGGALFIGVRDDKTVQGLDDYDFQLANRKNPKDFFLCEYDDMIKQFLGLSTKSHIDGYFYEIDRKNIFVVVVSPNKRRPIFLKRRERDGEEIKEIKEFYIRLEASTHKLSDIEEIVNYWVERGKD